MTFLSLSPKIKISFALDPDTHLLKQGNETYARLLSKQLRLLSSEMELKILFECAKDPRLFFDWLLDTIISGHQTVLISDFIALNDQGFLIHSIYYNEIKYLSIHPRGEEIVYGLVPMNDQSFRFRSEIIATFNDRKLTLQSTQHSAQLQLEDPSAYNLIYPLIKGSTLQHLKKAINLDKTILEVIISVFIGLQMLEIIGQHTAEFLDVDLLHQYFFYTRSFPGLHVKMPTSKSKQLELHEHSISLDTSELAAPNNAFFTILHKRRSTRVFSKTQLHFSFLALLLQESTIPGKVRSGAQPFFYNYPSSGGIYELGIYLVAFNIGGLEKGLYRYNIHENTFTLLSQFDLNLEKIFFDCLQAAAIPNDSYPGTQIIITSKVDLLRKKYQEKALHLSLQNTGCLYQTMNLVATALSIGFCVTTYITNDLIKYLHPFLDRNELPLGGMIVGVAD